MLDAMKQPSPQFMAPCGLLSSVPGAWGCPNWLQRLQSQSVLLPHIPLTHSFIHLPLGSTLTECQEKHPKGSYLSRTYDGLAGFLPGKNVIQNKHVWGWYPRKQLEYECSLNYQIIGSSCPIRNEPGPSETLKYSEHLSVLQYEHHLHNEVSRVQAVVLLC